MDERHDLERLVGAAQRRDPDAVAGLFDRYYGAVYRYAYARLGSVADAEDAAAETFAAVIRTLPRFRWRGVPFEAWLFRIARSKTVDVVRQRSRTGTTLVAASEPADPDTDPALVHANRESRRALVTAVDRLPAAQRDVVILRFFVGRSIRDTAAHLGRSEGAVKQLQLRALARLRRETGR